MNRAFLLISEEKSTVTRPTLFFGGRPRRTQPANGASARVRRDLLWPRAHHLERIAPSVFPLCCGIRGRHGMTRIC